MKTVLASPWLTVSLAIVIMTIGYTVRIVQNGEIARASYQCPAQAICQEGKCAEKGACTVEGCESCPRCKKEATS